MEITRFYYRKYIFFFKRFQIATSFLQKDPSEWKKDKEYTAAKAMLSTLQVVNDHAERGVKMFQDFNKILTRNEESKQFLLQVVAGYRKKYPDHSKSSLSRSKFD